MISGVDSSSLQRWTFRNIGGSRVRIGREMGTIRTICRSIPRVCPECIRTAVNEHGFTGAFIRADWHVVSVRTCAIHSLALMRMPCSKYTLENYDIAAVVRKNFDLFTRHIDMHRQESSLEAYLRMRIGGMRQTGFWPDILTLPVVARAAETLGGRVLFGPQAKSAQLSEDMLHAAGGIGFDIISGGVETLKTCLNDLTRESSDSRKFHRRDYGMFLTWLSSSRAAPEMKPLKSVVRAHMIENFPLKSGSIVLGSVIARPRLLSVTDAAKELSMKPGQLLRFLREKEGALSNGVTERQGVCADALQSLKDEVNDQITVREATSILNCSFDLVQKLADCLILPFHTRGGAARYVSRKDAMRLLHAVECLPAIKQHGNFLTAVRIRENIACRASEILKLFMQGELAPAYRERGVRGINGLLVDIEQLRSKISTRDTKFVLFRDACRVLHLKSSELHILASMEFVRMKICRDPDSGCRRKVIESATLDGFRARFATLGMLASELSRRALSLRKDLEILGVRSMFLEDELPKIYERSNLPDAKLLFTRWRKAEISAGG
ncbi:hypothetical protein C9E82_23610 [Paracoccus siganidrum]|uniref:TniQ domain-containing protein n=1 Tax=Paracoccus siganidrum TaxID=1276757 RepID=A0A418ZR96_9RHOB|nr:hypothetical protein D3P05_23700 [Paracoccus siganidrum]RMC24128.1 hypothetical protein C9E82_23610 [Paracoccus siganidrum]